MAITVIRSGKAVQMLWTVLNNTNAQSSLYDPPTLPVITLLDPTGSAQVTTQPMVRINQGRYSFTYITPTNGALGIWTALVDVVDSHGTPGGSVDPDVPQKSTPVFQLV